MTQPSQPKVFGIGLNKTGTTTLNQCGRILGYQCAPYSHDLIQKVHRSSDLNLLFKYAEPFDLFEDWPWPLYFQQLDQRFPGSKFILTRRSSPDKWLESLKKHSMRTSPLRNARRMMYGHYYPQGHEAAHLQFYSTHLEKVRAYFADRPNDLLELCWEEGHGWEGLCGFLEKPIPEKTFPHANSGDVSISHRWNSVANHLLCKILP